MDEIVGCEILALAFTIGERSQSTTQGVSRSFIEEERMSISRLIQHVPIGKLTTKISTCIKCKPYNCLPGNCPVKEIWLVGNIKCMDESLEVECWTRSALVVLPILRPCHEGSLTCALAMMCWALPSRATVGLSQAWKDQKVMRFQGYSI